MFGFLKRYLGLTWVAIACLGVSLAGCASTDFGDGDRSDPTPISRITVESDGPESQQSAERVIALSSVSADIVITLDNTKLVGIPQTSLLEKNSKFAEIETLGSGQTPDLETLVELQPDLVIGAAGMQGQILARVEELGIPVIGYELNNLEDLESLTLEIADQIGANPEPLVSRYQGFIPEEFSASPGSVLVLAGTQPVVAPSRQSWAGDLLGRLEVNNLSASWEGDSPFSGYVTLSPEKIVEANPETILVIATPGNEDALASFEALPFWESLQAVNTGQVHVFNYYGLVNPGSLDKIEGTYQQLTEILGE